MGWTSPKTWSTNDVLTSTDMDTYVRDNSLYVHSGRPNARTVRDNAASYQTASTAWTLVDVINGFRHTITPTSGKILVGFTGVVDKTSASAVCFDVQCGGTRVGTAGNCGLAGLGSISSGVSTPGPVSFVVPITGLGTTAYQVDLMWRVTSGTATLYAGDGGTVTDFIPVFWVTEIG
jgi:hypothetical protein